MDGQILTQAMEWSLKLTANLPTKAVLFCGGYAQRHRDWRPSRLLAQLAGRWGPEDTPKPVGVMLRPTAVRDSVKDSTFWNL
jgi:hypothetical protein